MLDCCRVPEQIHRDIRTDIEHNQHRTGEHSTVYGMLKVFFLNERVGLMYFMKFVDPMIHVLSCYDLLTCVCLTYVGRLCLGLWDTHFRVLFKRRKTPFVIFNDW